MLGELPQDIVGTSPKYLPIVDHSWLDVDTATYDNYPSDNNSVRVLPKLSEMWNPEAKYSGIMSVPNTGGCSCRVRSAEDRMEAVKAVVKEAKKAMMSGIYGKRLAEHIRSRFIAEDINGAKEELAKLSDEQGLLGNVYIDVSAFDSGKELERYLSSHESRLAGVIIAQGDKLNPQVISFLANRFRKNVSASVEYTKDLLNKYKGHLVASGKIPFDFVVESKEDLRRAFMHVPQPRKAPVVAHTTKKISLEEAEAELSNRASKQARDKKASEQELTFKEIYPLVVFARENLSKGKDKKALKDMMRSRFIMDDIKKASSYLSMILSDLSAETINNKVASEEITEYIGAALIKMGKKYPVTAKIEAKKIQASFSGVKGYVHSLNGTSYKDELISYKEEAVSQLKLGKELVDIQAYFADKLSNDQIDRVITDAVSLFNQSPSGVKANTYKKAPKVKVAEVDERPSLPDPSSVIAENKEMVSFFDGSNSMDIAIDDPIDNSNLEVGDISGTAGMDAFL